MLTIENMTVSYSGLTIVNKVSFSVEENQWLMILGPNGAGKSTIINAISQLAPYQGKVMLNGRDVARIKPLELAKEIGVLSQNHFPGYSFTVEEVVRLGRYAYGSGPFGSTTREDEEKIEQALELTGLNHQRDQEITSLSGGELQRTFVAQLFAQSPRLLLLDEPTNHLDLIYQKEIFRLIGNWLKQKNVAVVSVVHDLSLAKAYGTHGLLLQNGNTIAQGSINQVMSRKNLEKAYNMDVYKWFNELNKNWHDKEG